MSNEAAARAPGESQDATQPLPSVHALYEEATGDDAHDDAEDGPPPLVDAPPSMTFTFNTDMTPYEGGLQSTTQFLTTPPSISPAFSVQPSGGQLVSLYSNDAFIGGGRTNRRRVQDPDYIPRAPNAFILFRASFVRTHQLEAGSGGKKDKLGKLVGQAWRALPTHERAEWEARAALAQEEHRRRYPDWRFKPQQIAAGLGQPSGPRPRKGRIKDGGGGNYNKGEGGSKDSAAASRTPAEVSGQAEESQNASSSADVYEFSGPQILLDQPEHDAASEEHSSITGSSPSMLHDQASPGQSPTSCTSQFLAPPTPDLTSGRVRSKSVAVSTRSRSTPSRRGRGRSVDLSGTSRHVLQSPESPRKRSAKTAELSTQDEHGLERGRNTGVSPPRKRQDKGKGREGSVIRGVPGPQASSKEPHEQAQWEGPPATPESSFSSPVLSEAAAAAQPLQITSQGPLNIRFFHDPRSASSPQKVQRGASGELYAAPGFPSPPLEPRTPVMSPATTIISPMTSPTTSFASPFVQPAAIRGIEGFPVGDVPLTEMFKRSSSAPPAEKGSSASPPSAGDHVPDFIARREEEEESGGGSGSSSGSTTPQNVVRPTPPGSSGISTPFGVGKVGQLGVGWSGAGPLFPGASTAEGPGIGVRPTHGRRETISLPVQRTIPVQQQPQYAHASSAESLVALQQSMSEHQEPAPSSGYITAYQHLQPAAQHEGHLATHDSPHQQQQQSWVPLTTEGMGYECSDWQPYRQPAEDSSGIAWSREEGRQGMVAAIEAPKADDEWPSKYGVFPETADFTTQESPEPPPVMLPVSGGQNYGPQSHQQPVEYSVYYGTGWAGDSWAQHASHEPARTTYGSDPWARQQTIWAQGPAWNQQAYYPQYTQQSPHAPPQLPLSTQPQQTWAQPQHAAYVHAQHLPYAQPAGSPYARSVHASAQVSPLASPAMKGLPPAELSRQDWGGGWATGSEDFDSHTSHAYPSGWTSYQGGGWDAPPDERR